GITRAEIEAQLIQRKESISRGVVLVDVQRELDIRSPPLLHRLQGSQRDRVDVAVVIVQRFWRASVLNPCSIVWLLETLRNGPKLPVPELLCPVAPVKMAPLIESDRPGAVDRSTTVGVTRSSRHSTFGTVDGTRLTGAIRRRADREELERTLRARVRERSHAGEDMVISS